MDSHFLGLADLLSSSPLVRVNLLQKAQPWKASLGPCLDPLATCCNTHRPWPLPGQCQSLETPHELPLNVVDTSFILLQYNCISLGLAMAAAAAVLEGYEVLGSIFYCLSLNHKQVRSRSSFRLHMLEYEAYPLYNLISTLESAIYR